MPNDELKPLLRSLLVRLVRIAIRCGITYQAFSRTLRRVYVEVATAYEPVDGKPATDGRVSVLTGLSRRDIRTIRNEPDEAGEPHRSLDWLVIDRWSSSLDFVDEDGGLRPLPRTRRRGGEQSFEALVASVSKEVWPRSLLDEWLRAGKVVLDDKDRVVFVKESMSSVGDQSGNNPMALALAHFLADLLTGFDSRFVAGRDGEGKGIKSSVLYGHRLTEESVRLIRRKAAESAASLTTSLNRLVLERERLDSGNPEAWRRLTVGTGIFETDQREDPGLLYPSEGGAKPSAADRRVRNR
jgi:hypothetical protein